MMNLENDQSKNVRVYEDNAGHLWAVQSAEHGMLCEETGTDMLGILKVDPFVDDSVGEILTVKEFEVMLENRLVCEINDDGEIIFQSELDCLGTAGKKFLGYILCERCGEWKLPTDFENMGLDSERSVVCCDTCATESDGESCN